MENPNGPSPTLENVELVANAFGLQGWNLIMPNLIDDLINGDSGISLLVHNYLESNRDGRQHLIRVAEREAEYHGRDAS